MAGWNLGGTQGVVFDPKKEDGQEMAVNQAFLANYQIPIEALSAPDFKAITQAMNDQSGSQTGAIGPQPYPEPKTWDQRIDNTLTNYLRNTTTSQEILDFYGEGNIIGRKGIPEDTLTLLDAMSEAMKNGNSVRPRLESQKGSFGLLGDSDYAYRTIDMPDLKDPATSRPWQMQVGTITPPGHPKLTPAAQQYLADFRIPYGGTKDYSFDIGPNIEDRKIKKIQELLQGWDAYQSTNSGRRSGPIGVNQDTQDVLSSYGKDALAKIQTKEAGYVRPNGRPATPSWWKEQGFAVPDNLKDTVLETFKGSILNDQPAFGSVSTLYPVDEPSSSLRPGGNKDWRAKLYEKTGLAGPLGEVTYNSGYGSGTGRVQAFVPGKDRLLPIQPYDEFVSSASDLNPVPGSALKTQPAPDFTPFEKRVGPRNVLITRNIAEGRGSLGTPVRVARAATTAIRKPVGGLLLDAAIGYGLGQPAQEAIVDAAVTGPLSGWGIGQAPGAAIERMGPKGEFVDTRSNTVLSRQGRPTNQGVAYRNGRAVLVPRGSVAGEGNLLTQTRDIVRQASNVWRNRLKRFGLLF